MVIVVVVTSVAVGAVVDTVGIVPTVVENVVVKTAVVVTVIVVLL